MSSGPGGFFQPGYRGETGEEEVNDRELSDEEKLAVDTAVHRSNIVQNIVYIIALSCVILLGYLLYRT